MQTNLVDRLHTTYNGRHGSPKAWIKAEYRIQHVFLWNHNYETRKKEIDFVLIVMSFQNIRKKQVFKHISFL